MMDNLNKTTKASGKNSKLPPVMLLSGILLRAIAKSVWEIDKKVLSAFVYLFLSINSLVYEHSLYAQYHVDTYDYAALEDFIFAAFENHGVIDEAILFPLIMLILVYAVLEVILIVVLAVLAIMSSLMAGLSWVVLHLSAKERFQAFGKHILAAAHKCDEFCFWIPQKLRQLAERMRENMPNLKEGGMSKWFAGASFAALTALAVPAVDSGAKISIAEEMSEKGAYCVEKGSNDCADVMRLAPMHDYDIYVPLSDLPEVDKSRSPKLESFILYASSIFQTGTVDAPNGGQKSPKAEVVKKGDPMGTFHPKEKARTVNARDDATPRIQKIYLLVGYSVGSESLKSHQESWLEEFREYVREREKAEEPTRFRLMGFASSEKFAGAKYEGYERKYRNLCKDSNGHVSPSDKNNCYLANARLAHVVSHLKAGGDDRLESGKCEGKSEAEEILCEMDEYCASQNGDAKDSQRGLKISKSIAATPWCELGQMDRHRFRITGETDNASAENDYRPHILNRSIRIITEKHGSHPDFKGQHQIADDVWIEAL